MTRILNFIYSIGAAIVIFGAWQKIEHKASADMFLTAGLLTEVIIFCIYGLRELTVKEHAAASGSSADNSELTASIDQLTNTIKKIFNR